MTERFEEIKVRWLNNIPLEVILNHASGDIQYLIHRYEEMMEHFWDSASCDSCGEGNCDRDMDHEWLLTESGKLIIACHVCIEQERDTLQKAMGYIDYQHGRFDVWLKLMRDVTARRMLQ